MPESVPPEIEIELTVTVFPVATCLVLKTALLENVTVSPATISDELTETEAVVFPSYVLFDADKVKDEILLAVIFAVVV